jgi:hypothetical protein
MYNLSVSDYFSPLVLRYELCHFIPGNISPSLPRNNAKMLSLTVLPRMRRRPKEVTSNQYFDLTASLAKLERALSMITTINLTGVYKDFRLDIFTVGF